MADAAYLVQYGRTAFVGRFAAGGFEVSRGDRVVVRTPRGAEIGTALREADVRFDVDESGEVLRAATPDDEATAARLEHVGRDLLDAAERRAADLGLPMTFLDGELMLDGPAVLHAVAWEPCDADPLFAELSERFGRPVRLHDVSRTPVLKDPPEKASTCGKPGCGSGGCSDGGCGTKAGGCSTGGCSRGSVKSADELTAYFAGLRRQMEEAHRTPLC